MKVTGVNDFIELTFHFSARVLYILFKHKGLNEYNLGKEIFTHGYNFSLATN